MHKEYRQGGDMASDDKASLNFFVIMPFGTHDEYKEKNKESNHIYESIIIPSIKSFENEYVVKHQREVDRKESGFINKKIIRSLAQADIVIADLTGRNPNVFLELGIRYVLRSKITILMAQKGTAIPFDIKNYKFLEYDPFEIAASQEDLVNFIKEGLKQDYHSDSIVFDIFNTLSVVIPGISESHGASLSSTATTTMRWDNYLVKL